MKLSICILTHNRPELFSRAIDSVLRSTCDYEYDILVNNDTRDIIEIHNDDTCISYSYIRSSDLSNIYKYLYDTSTGEFVYFLEDDDYIDYRLLSQIDFNYDINYMTYTSIPHICEVGVKEALQRQNLNNHLLYENSYSKFISEFNDTYFQLSQLCFRRNSLEEFPTGNDINNDFNLFKSFHRDSTINYINQQLWIQTTDGNDNISFDNLNTDERFY